MCLCDSDRNTIYMLVFEIQQQHEKLKKAKVSLRTLQILCKQLQFLLIQTPMYNMCIPAFTPQMATHRQLIGMYVYPPQHEILVDCRRTCHA